MSVPDLLAARLAGEVLAPHGARLALADWVAEGQAGAEPEYQAPLHRHEEDEAWYVLAGVPRVRIGDREVEVPAGGAAIVPGGRAHTYYNPAPEPARYLLVMGTRTYALIQALHTGEERDPEELRRLFRDYGAELLE